MADQILAAETRPTTYEVSCLPQDHPDGFSWALRVEYRGRGKWAVLRSGKRCLSSTGEWDWESIPSEREDDWLATHRFDLDTALRLAQEAAPHVVVNGLTPAGLLEWEAAHA